MKVKIIGAGSIGNHHARACRAMGWNVTVVDTNLDALERMRHEIYPNRYGSWDDRIRLQHDYQGGKDVPKGDFDIIMIDVPPDVRMELALLAIKEKPRILHLEKPLCTPSRNGLYKFLSKHKKEFGDCKLTVGYNHAVSKSVEEVVKIIKSGSVGPVITIDVEFREHWEGIFKAHPWLNCPEDSYLGYWERGGGAGGEHSHALHLWLYFATVANLDLMEEVKSDFDIVNEKYDRIAAFILKTRQGNIGMVVQDVVTNPPRKWARVQGTNGFVEWHCNETPENDLVRFQSCSSDIKDIQEIRFLKSRQQDFLWLMQHYDDLLFGRTSYKDSPLHIDYGIRVMNILHYAHEEYFA